VCCVCVRARVRACVSECIYVYECIYVCACVWCARQAATSLKGGGCEQLALTEEGRPRRQRSPGLGGKNTSGTQPLARLQQEQEEEEEKGEEEEEKEQPQKQQVVVVVLFLHHHYYHHHHEDERRRATTRRRLRSGEAYLSSIGGHEKGADFALILVLLHVC